MVEFCVNRSTKTPSFFDSAELLCKMCKILSASGQMFLLKILRNLVVVITIVSDGVFYDLLYVVMLQLVLTKQEPIHVRSTNYKKSNTSETPTQTHVSPDGDFSLYDSTAVSVCVRLYATVSNLKDTCPQWNGAKGLCPRSCRAAALTGESISYPQLSDHIHKTRTQLPLPTSIQCHLACHRLCHLSFRAEQCIVKCTGQGQCQVW